MQYRPALIGGFLARTGTTSHPFVTPAIEDVLEAGQLRSGLGEAVRADDRGLRLERLAGEDLLRGDRALSAPALGHLERPEIRPRSSSASSIVSSQARGARTRAGRNYDWSAPVARMRLS